jgi:NAD(P)-dependent dehydrogenase (short-subunit alcohol dehydrogenase family)
MANLRDKVAIITGGGNGIGRATAFCLAEAGATVVVADIEEHSARAVAESIVEKGGRALALRSDVGLAADVEDMVQQALDAYGRVDILHNNATWYPSKAAIETTEEEWDRTHAVSLKSAWLGARAVLPYMLEAGGGCIVNTASVHGLVAFRGSTAYDAAKAGLLGLTRSLALDYAPTVRVNAVAPGGVDTRLWNVPDPARRQAAIGAIPLKRLAKPEEIAGGVLFLVSEASAFMTGACLVMDGGWTIM